VNGTGTPVYLFCNIEVTDPERYRDYIALAGPAVARYGGRYLVRGPAPEVMEGDPDLKRVAIVEFPSSEAAKRFYDSPEYREARSKRAGAANFNAALLTGHEQAANQPGPTP
jgi:uncharacterized protein (DUF1330 family)